MPKKFEKQIQIKFREADPAGILFFGNILALTHDVFEDFVPATGLTWSDYFKAHDYIAPIRHAEVDFLSPFRPGEKYLASVSILRLGDSSFQAKTVFTQSTAQGSRVHAQVTTVHTFLNAQTFQKISVPEKFRHALAPYLETEAQT
jgi:acyl-CoA thioester hydrolase/1,4-dihydroxy-2-naphthoyl-CoA hydrolase